MKYLFTLLLLAGSLKAQILPNGDFEDIISPVVQWAEIEKCRGWFRGNESPHLFDTSGIAYWNPNLPTYVGRQRAHNNSRGYIGLQIYNWDTVPNNVYQQGKELAAHRVYGIQAGKRYEVCFFYNFPERMVYLPDSMQVLFTMDSVEFQAPPGRHHISYYNLPADTVNWIKMCGDFIADSNYNFIYIGTCYWNTATLSGFGDMIGGGLVHVDDVTVVEIPLLSSDKPVGEQDKLWRRVDINGRPAEKGVVFDIYESGRVVKRLIE